MNQLARILHFGRTPPPPVVLSGVIPVAAAVICADCDPGIIYNSREHRCCPVCGSAEAMLASRATDPSPPWPWMRDGRRQP